jgi:hypothetical protein
MVPARSQTTSGWLWLGAVAVGWLLFGWMLRLGLEYAIVGVQWARVWPPWSFESLLLPERVAIALLQGVVAALAVFMLRRFAHAPASVWVGVSVGAVIGLAAAHDSYLPGLWPTTAFALEQGIPAAGTIIGAFAGSRLFDRRAGRAGTESDRRSVEQALQPDCGAGELDSVRKA